MTAPDGPRRVPSQRDRAVVIATLVALAFSTFIAWAWFVEGATIPDQGDDTGYLVSAVYDPPQRPVEAALNTGDGQIFATQAEDPLARTPETLRSAPSTEAYRYQRGMLGWLGFLGSGGRHNLVPWVLIGICVASVTALVAVTAAMIARLGGRPLLALGMLVTPGVMTDLTMVGPEALGAALALAGLDLWRRGTGSRWPAIAALAAAGLCRETFLLVPAVLVVVELWSGDRRAAVRLGLAAAPYVAWVGYLRVALGAWPTGSPTGALSAVPGAGLVEALGRMDGGDVLGVTFTLAIGVIGLVVTRDLRLRALIGAHIAVASVFGPAVWAEGGVGRVLLPMAALGLVAIATPRARARVPIAIESERMFPHRRAPAR